MTDYSPTIPPKVRDAVYITGLIVSALVLLVVGLVGIWFPDFKDQTSESGVVITSFVALIVSGLGTAYRPGAQV
jgi:hypothetical protein